jgi:hypothetical protein
MNDLYLKHTGRAAVLREEIQALEHRIRSSLETLQLKADPLEGLSRLDGNSIAALGVNVGNLLIEWKNKTEQLAAVERALGR